MTGQLSSIDDIIADARAGRMYILVDDEQRENEGDLVIPAQFATPETINFMAREGRGLICLALTRDRIDTLRLPAMSAYNGTHHETAFTVSIEAREGVTTGISAADRAHTIQVAIDPTKSSEHITTPGHVFPLSARDGGVLVRAGHTEAAVDISRLAGLNPAGVICEIMNDDGTMARLDDLMVFAQRHGLKVGTIADLIRYRRSRDVLIECTSEQVVESEHGGTWTVRIYRNKTENSEHLALVKGEIRPDETTLVRMHSYSIYDDLLARTGGRAHLREAAMDVIGREGRGVFVLLRSFESLDYSELVRAANAQREEASGATLREYGVGAQILLDLGVKDMEILSNSQKDSIIGLESFGLRIAGTRSF